MIGRQRARWIFCALALSTAVSGNVIITSGTAQTVYNSLFDFLQTDVTLDGAGFSADLGFVHLNGLTTPTFLTFGPTPVGFDFTQHGALFSLPLSSTSNLTYNGTAYGAGYALDLQLNFSGPHVGPQATSCDYSGFPPVLLSCSADWGNVPFTMVGFFRILRNGGVVAADTLTGSGLASSSAFTDRSRISASVNYVFTTTPEPSSLVLATGGLFCLGLLVRRRRLHDEPSGRDRKR